MSQSEVKPVGSRLVDRTNGQRTRPMKVLALGQARTGTSSLREALVKVGYKPFHFSGMMVDWETQVPLWTEAIEQKYTSGTKPYGREEFDRMIGDYDVVEDNPGIIFAEELIKAYPDAKVILTNRDKDAWVQSMFKTVFRNKKNPFFRYLAPLFPFAGSWWKILNLIIDKEYAGGNDPAEVKKAYEDHYAQVRALVPKENLLEMHFGDGWEKVCPFLDIKNPGLPWPHANDGNTFNSRQDFFGRNIFLTVSVVALTIGLLTWQLPQAYRQYPAVKSGTNFFLISLAGGIFWPWAASKLLALRANYLSDSVSSMS